MGRKEQYQHVIQQLDGLLQGEKDRTANLANIAAVLKSEFGFFWVGFYLVKEDELVLGPFQGPVACTRIRKGKGVCGTSWADKKTYLVPDVHEFPGHIACNAASRSEVVVPIIDNEEVSLVLDVDSDHLDHFDQDDVQGLEEVGALIGKNWSTWN